MGRDEISTFVRLLWEIRGSDLVARQWENCWFTAKAFTRTPLKAGIERRVAANARTSVFMFASLWKADEEYLIDEDMSFVVFFMHDKYD
jgi:hypothetical protein